MCEHYVRKCEIKCGKCSKFYSCKKCHDIIISLYNEDIHIIDTVCNIIRCLNCGKEQNASETCDECNIKFGQYSCLKCKYYGNMRSYHCDKCDICYNRDTHECFDRDIKCVICLDNISDMNNMYKLPCHHIIHRTCMIQLSNANHSKCPLCRNHIRLSYLCDYCNLNLLETGYSCKISHLNCGHKLHLECSLKWSTYLSDEIVLTQLDCIPRLLKEGKIIKQRIICHKCNAVSECVLKS